MPEVIEISDSEPELPRNSKSTVKTTATTSGQADRFNYAFAEFDDRLSSELSRTHPVATSSKARDPLAIKEKFQNHSTITVGDGVQIPFLSDDFDTTLGSVFNDTPAQQKMSTDTSLKAPSKEKEIYVLDDSDDPFTSPPAAKRQKLSPPRDKAPRAGAWKRTVSEIEPVKSNGPRTYNERGLKRSRTTGSLPISDPITFTSSPDVSMKATKKGKERESYIVDDDDELERPRIPSNLDNRRQESDDPFDSNDDFEMPSVFSNSNNKRQELSDPFDSNDDLPPLEGLDARHLVKEKPRNPIETHLEDSDDEQTTRNNSRKPSIMNIDDSDVEAAAGAKSRKKTGSAEDRARKAAEKKTAKEAEKEQKRIEREYTKAAKAKEKEKAKDLAKANIDRTKPEVSLPEMTVLLPDILDAAVKGQTTFALDDLGCKHAEWAASGNLVVKWNRTVTSRFNPETDIWEPMRAVTKEEKHILIYVPAKKFVEIALLGTESIDSHITTLKTHFPSHSIIYLIEGLTAWRRHNRSISDRQYKAAVRSHIPSEIPTTAQRKQKARDEGYVEADDAIEDALLNLQVLHEVFIHHTSKPSDTAKWIAKFTVQISTIPYMYVFPPFPLFSHGPKYHTNPPSPRIEPSKKPPQQPSACAQAKSKRA
jgi:crossover junction endonuclease EME1